MNALSSLFVWANLPYISAFTIAILFALLQMTGLLGLLMGDSDHDADHDIDADHDVDAEADHDVDADHDADNDAENEQSGSLGGKILVDLGVGRVPFSTLWQAFAITFGISGLAINSLVVAPGGAAAPRTLAFTVPFSLLVAYLITRTMTRILGRALAGEHEEASSRKDLVGSTGTVISTQVTEEFGEIRVTDPAGRLVHLICRIRDAEKPIPSGREVVIVDYDAKTGHIFVSPLDVDLSDDKPTTSESSELDPPAEAENDDASAKQTQKN